MRRVRSAAAVVVLSCALTGCPADQPDSTSSSPAPSRPAESTAGPARRTPETLPSTPSGRAAVLAEQLDRAEHILRDRDAAPGDVRRAGEFTQLAARTVADKPRVFRRDVLERLGPVAATATRANLAAAADLHAITDPQRTLPDWRIVRPPSVSRLRGYYQRAQRRTGVPWAYLAAIHLVETRMGRIRGTSSAGARGPMQFLPTTWDIYGKGGDITDPRDAILAAGRLLRAFGAPDDMAEALYHYNPSDSYVRAVTAYAAVITRSPMAYRGYWHWRVLYRHIDGTYALPIGYPDVRPVLVERAD